ncbi:10-formyltetrahydrofolate:L-methionyl-tRNA(fMet) N-formyltransferase [Desulfovibrionales bacterium]
MAAQRMQRLKAVFMGTSTFAAVILRAILNFPLVNVVGIFTQPDRPAGRGRHLQISPVKRLALQQNIAIIQPERLQTPEQQQLVAALNPEVILVAAYGLILPQVVLDIPRLGCINVHASLLSRYRGAAPIQRAILAGDTTTGITIIKMNAQLDAGDILLQRALVISFEDTALILHDQLAVLGAQLLIEALQRLTEGTLQSTQQDHSLATYAPKLTKAEGRINWDRPAVEVHNHIRAFHPWPGAWFFWERYGAEHLRLTLQPGRLGLAIDSPTTPGCLQGLVEQQLAIACRDRMYLIPNLTPEGKSVMDARSFYNGYFICQK